jgi:hypothetical protein
MTRRPDVAVIDVVLADARGDDLAAELRRRHPGIGVVLVSVAPPAC